MNRARRAALWRLAGGLLLALPLPGRASPRDAQAPATALSSALAGTDGWQRWGSGEFRWLGFAIYTATLWVAGSSPQTAPHALQLVYHRELSAARLVDASIDSLRRRGVPDTDLARWRPMLAQLLPDVTAGDDLQAIHAPGLGVRFYHRGHWLGDVADAEFARQFLAIWLGPAPRQPELQAALLTPPAGPRP